MSVQGNMRENLVPAVLDGPDCAAHPRLARLGLGSGSARAPLTDCQVSGRFPFQFFFHVFATSVPLCAIFVFSFFFMFVFMFFQVFFMCFFMFC